jgi:hypothetical protein
LETQEIKSTLPCESVFMRLSGYALPEGKWDAARGCIDKNVRLV